MHETKHGFVVNKDEALLTALRAFIRDEVAEVLSAQGQATPEPANVRTATSRERRAVPRFFFVEEAAVEIRRSVAGTRWLINTGALESSKVGGRRVVTQEQVNAFLNGAE